MAHTSPPQSFGSPRHDKRALRDVNFAWAILGLAILVLIIAVLAFTSTGRFTGFDTPAGAPPEGQRAAPTESPTPVNPTVP